MGRVGVSLSRFIALRYVSVGKRSQLVSFMSSIAVLGLALGVAILITVLSVMNGFDREMRETILGIVPHLTISSEENLGTENWAEIDALINSNAKVSSIAPAIQVAGIAATDSGNRGILINGIDAATEAESSAIANFFIEGNLASLDSTRWGVVIGQALAQQLEVGVGDRVTLYSSSISINPLTPLAIFRGFEVVGIFKVGTQDLDSSFAMINQSAARALFRLRTPYNALRLRIDNVLAADSIAMDLDRSLPRTVTIESWTRQLGAIYDNIRFSRNIISFMLWLLVAVAAFNLVVSLVMIVRDKRADIAILRTLGASPGMVTGIFMWQGSFIGIMGIALGVALGIVGALNITDFARWIEIQFDLQLLNADVYPIDFLPSQISATDILGVVVGVFILAFAATIYPARRAAAVQPAAALRHD